MKRCLLLPAPCSWGLAILLAASAIPARAVTLSLPGMAGIAPPPVQGGSQNLAVDAGGAGKGGGGNAGTSSATTVARASTGETSGAPKRASSSGGTKKKTSSGAPKKKSTPKKKSSDDSPRKIRPEAEPEPEIIPQEDTGMDTPPPALPPVSGKDTVPAPAVAGVPDLRPTLFLTTGWSDKLYFRGLDILDRVSPDSAGSGALTARAKVVKGGWEFGAQYLQALDRQLPDRDAAKTQPNLVDGTGLWNPGAGQFPSVTNPNAFSVPSRERYAELDLWASYTKSLGHDFTGTLGVTYYHFLDKQWWGLSSSTEVQAGLSYSGFKWVEPSLLYAYDFNGFEGGYAELTVSAKNIPYWPLFGAASGMQFSAVPYLKLSYDMKYNGEGNDWNHIEAGVNVPVVLNEHLALNLTASYNHSLSEWEDRDSRPGTTLNRDRADDGWWFGLSLSTATKIGPFANKGLPDYSGKDKVPMMTATNSKWSFSGGMGLHSIGADFGTSAQHPVSSLGVVPRRTSSGLGFATSAADKTYSYFDESGATPVVRSGTVHSNTQPGSLDGTSKFTGGQVSGTRAERNQQVRFLADEYSYSDRVNSFDRYESDEDSVLFPYLRVDYEITKTASGTLSVGLIYSYTAAEMDTGIDLSSLDSAFERRTQHHYLYDVNEIDDADARTPGAATIIFDDEAMAADPFFASSPAAQNFYAQRDPQEATIVTEIERKRLATFVSSDLDVSMHSLAIPVSWEWDVTERAHVALSAGVSLNLFNAELDTDVWVQDIPQLANGVIISNNTGDLVVRTGASLAGDFVEGTQGAGKAGGTSSGVPGSANTPSGGGSVVIPPGGLPATVPATPVGAPAGIGGLTGVGGTPGTGTGGGKGGVALSPRLPGTNIYSRTWSADDTSFQFGLFAQASIKYDLDLRDRWYLEAWGRYDWIQSFNIGNGVTSAEVDASSWAVGAGVGMRF